MNRHTVAWRELSTRLLLHDGAVHVLSHVSSFFRWHGDVRVARKCTRRHSSSANLWASATRTM